MSETTEMTVTRVFDAPRELVWKVETEPEYFAQWFGAKAESVELDVRTGGGWRATVITPDGSEIPLAGRYVEVVKPERLVLTIPGGPGEVEATITLADLGNKTEVSFASEVEPEARESAKVGTESIFDKIAEILAKL